jgi:sorbitol-specific phosphotransferase system component IIA
LLVEIGHSTLRFDREVKARLYARHGIAEPWVPDFVIDLAPLA